jgi:ribosomal protein L6P/L9E
MKDISSVESLTIPEGVTVAIKSRIVTVEGPRGKLVKNVGHVQMDIQLVSGSITGMMVKQRIGMEWDYGREGRILFGTTRWKLGIHMRE